MPTADFLDLAEFEVIDNAIHLKRENFGSVEQIDARIREKKAQIKRLTELARTGAGNPAQKANLTRQVEILQRYREKHNGERYKERAAARANKARIDSVQANKLNQSAMYRNPRNSIESFTEFANQNPQPARKSFYQETTPGGVEVKIPQDVSRHGKNEHNLTADEWRQLLNNIDNVEAASFGIDANKYGPAIRLKVRAGDVVYGVVISPDGYISTAFNTNETQTTEASIDNWISEKKTAGRSDRNPTSVSGRSLFDIITQVRNNVKPQDTHYNNADIMELVGGNKEIYDRLYSLPNGQSIINGITAALQSFNNLIKAQSQRNIKKEIAAAIGLLGHINKDNFIDFLQVQQAIGNDADPFITGAFLYAFTQDSQAGITQFINTFVAKAELNAEKVAQSKEKDLLGNSLSNEQELTNTEIISQSLTEQYSNKTFGGKTNPQPIFNQDGLAVQPEMRAVFLAQAHKATANLFNQTDIVVEPNIIDLTEEFAELKGKTAEEKRKIITGLLQKLIGAELETKDGKIIAVREPETPHIEGQVIKRGGKQTKRAITALSELKAIANEATQIEESDVDSAHNKSESIKKLKDTYEKHFVFEAPISIDDDVFYVILSTNSLKNDSNKNRSYLYEVYVKRTPYNENSSSRGSFANSITENPNFVKWFGNSQVVDADGEPLVVYHGTDFKGIDTFDLKKSKNGFFFTPIKGQAEKYGKIIMPVYLSLRNPIHLDSYEKLRNINVKELSKQGYDGAYYQSDTQPIYVAFSPNQIKSATGNNGDFDPKNPNIYRQGVNGYYDPELNTIVLGKNSNSGTLPHEFAHFWLEKVFNLTHLSPEKVLNSRVVAEFGPLFQMLGVSDEQTQLTREQHEQFATMTEAYIFGLAPLPLGAEYAFRDFQQFVPPKYESLLSIGYFLAITTEYNENFRKYWGKERKCTKPSESLEMAEIRKKWNYTNSLVTLENY